MAFKDIRGHRRIIILLQRAIMAGRISHSYLFVGPESVGKKTAAFNFAKSLNCSDPRYYEKELIDCCEACDNCRKINAMIHPDVRLYKPDGNSIKIEQMKEIQEKIQFKPAIGKWQVVIIDQAESMTTEAANCILKLLEEPPGYVVFIIISSNSFLLLPTVISRCQIYRFNLLSAGLIKDLLEEKLNLNQEKALLYSNMANGRMDRAIDFSQKKELEEFRTNIIDLVSGAKGDYIWKVTTAKDKVNIDKLNIYKSLEKASLSFPEEKLNVFFDFILIWFRDLLIFKQIKARDKLINIDKVRIIQNEVDRLSLQEIYYRIQNVSRAKEHIKKNVNIRLVLENFVSVI